MAGIEERIAKLEKILNRVMCCDTNVFTGPQGAPGEDGIDGVQGPTGPQGVPGPVGPTGLNWQGAFVPCVVYSENDAVSFDGSSYFVTCETTDGSECETPYDNTSCWGLLANQGAVGPEGPQGLIGLTGATGARGLTWRGAWVSPTFYSIDDAVSFNGTSYICISNSIITTNPAITPLKWSVLAAKGAQGITGTTGSTGAPGPPGPPGPPGSVVNKSILGVIASSVSPYPLLAADFNNISATSASPVKKVLLRSTTALIGQEVTVYNIGLYNVVVKAIDPGFGYIYANGWGDYVPQEITVNPGQAYRFTYLNSNQWDCEIIEPNPGYGSFVAKVTTGLTSTVDIVKNTLNTTVSLTTDGTSLKILLGDPIMTNTNTYISVSNYLSGGAFYMFHPERTDPYTMYLRGRNLAGLQALGFGGEVYVELRVYTFFY
jgi:hypothetical protein